MNDNSPTVVSDVWDELLDIVMALMALEGADLLTDEEESLLCNIVGVLDDADPNWPEVITAGWDEDDTFDGMEND
jgi:hypothetical protein